MRRTRNADGGKPGSRNNLSAPPLIVFFHDCCVTVFCSCKIGIPYVRYISSVSSNLHLLPWMACMQVLQEQMPATKKSELKEVHFGFLQINLSALVVAHFDPFSGAGILVINMKTGHCTAIQVVRDHAFIGAWISGQVNVIGIGYEAGNCPG